MGISPFTFTPPVVTDTSLPYAEGLKSEFALVRKQAFEALWKDKVKAVLGYLRSKFPYMPSDLLSGAVNDAFLAVWNYIEDKKRNWDVDPFVSLGGIYECAMNGAIDAHRVYTKRGKRLMQLRPNEQMIESAFGEVERGREDSRSAERIIAGVFREQRWAQEQYAAKRSDRVIAAVEEGIAQLPDKQKRVALILANNWEDELTLKDLQELYQKTYRVTLTHDSAKTALREIRKKLRVALAGLFPQDEKNRNGPAQP